MLTTTETEAPSSLEETSTTATTTTAETIKIYCRVRPNFKKKKNTSYYSLRENENKSNLISFFVPKDESQGLINNSKEQFDFEFSKIFDQKATQDELFDTVGKEVVDSALDGFNGTIFCYGQTGTGKTFTMTGGPASYDDRGLIPRAIQYLFSEIQKRSSKNYSVSISYLELYNEAGYDLLSSSRDYSSRDDTTSKIVIQEDSNENVFIRNLSRHNVANDEEALNLLFVGDTNKVMAETPSNPCSSRSHCIFTILITGSEVGCEKIRRSKLHLVDLAGSERAARTRIDGTTLKEAKYINLSLHFLEQVIIALYEKSLGMRSHVPYRNSLMTYILRDSLGGNCKTRMIATIAVEDEVIDESLSTCKFAQRVALIKNIATINEEMDLSIVVERLKEQVRQLKAEILILKQGKSIDEPLEDNEKISVRNEAQQYIKTGEMKYLIEMISDSRKMEECLKFFRQKLLEKTVSLTESLYEFRDQDELIEKLRQRDLEIAVLTSSISNSKNDLVKEYENSNSKYLNKQTIPDSEGLNPLPKPPQDVEKLVIKSEEKINAFEEFRNQSDSFEKLKNLKKDYNQRREAAKALGETVKTLQISLKKHKEELEKLQIQKLVNLSAGEGSDKIDEEIEMQRELFSEEKVLFRSKMAQLKQEKNAIEHLKHSVDSSKVQIQKEFENWILKKKGRSEYMEEKRVVETLEDESVQDDVAAFFKAKQEFISKITKN